MEHLPTFMGVFNALSWESNNNRTYGGFSVKQIHRDRVATWQESGDFGDANFTLGGGGKAHAHSIPTSDSSSNIPLYITCYMWKRTA